MSSPQVSVSHLLALSGFPLEITGISVAYINRLGLYYLEPLVFTGTHLQHVFSRMPITATAALPIFKIKTTPGTGFSVPKCYDHFIVLVLMIFQPLLGHLMLLMQCSKFCYTMDWGTGSSGDEDAT